MTDLCFYTSRGKFQMPPLEAIEALPDDVREKFSAVSEANAELESAVAIRTAADQIERECADKSAAAIAARPKWTEEMNRKWHIESERLTR